MNYSFDTDIAKEYGVEEAIMIQNFQFWIARNKANGVNEYDDRTWTYNSAEAFTRLFPFWNRKQIERILKRLRNKGVIITANYNKIAYDRTLWYAFEDEKRFVPFPENGKSKSRKREISFLENGKPIPDIKPDIKPDSKIDVSKLGFEIPF